MSILVKIYENIHFSQNYQKHLDFGHIIKKNLDFGQNLQKSRIWLKFSKNLSFG